MNKTKRVFVGLAIIFSILALMFVEYRYIMNNLCPYNGENGTVYIEFFGQIDEYYADPITELEE